MGVKCGVVGNPIQHSLSPLIHQDFAKQAELELSYEKILATDAEFEDVVKRFFLAGGRGLNVTLPFKERAFQMAAVSTDRCQKAQAANTLWMHEGQLYADNTDGVGLLRDLTRHVDLNHKSILLVGAGGAARGILQPLLQSEAASVSLVNRTKAKALVLCEAFSGCLQVNLEDLQPVFDILIHATSAGFQQGAFSFPQQLFQRAMFCYDLSYNREQDTPFVQKAKQAGTRAMDGVGMLVEQAAESFTVWHGFKPETSRLIMLLRD